MTDALNQAGGYRVRVECGDFFSVEDDDVTAEEVFTLEGAIEAAESFIKDTEIAATSGDLVDAYAPTELEIVSPDGGVLSIDGAKRLLSETRDSFTLERFATGRFDVRKDGLRLGSVIGGRRTWCAEIGNRVVGYFKSPRKAGQAIVDEKLKTT